MRMPALTRLVFVRSRFTAQQREHCTASMIWISKRVTV
jgi:hypothetical protein